jgi:hypothetical protein
LPSKYWQKLGDYFAPQLETLRRLYLPYRGRLLFDEITKLREKLLHGQLQLSAPLTVYKNYSNYILELLTYQKTYGTSVQNSLFDLRESLEEDIRFEEKKWNVKLSSLGQFFLTAMCTWGFYFFTRWYFPSIHLSLGIKILLICWQSLGTFLFLVITKKREQKKLGGVEELLQSVQTFKVLLRAGLPLTKVVEKAQVMSQKSTDSRIKDLQKILRDALHQLITKGASIQNEVQFLIGELTYLKRDRLQSLEKGLEALKFLFLILFFLPTYFVMILSLFRSLA